ncbi:hypothetical protein TomTYG45_03780 [Sphingobium sp. TomTYG45]
MAMGIPPIGMSAIPVPAMSAIEASGMESSHIQAIITSSSSAAPTIRLFRDNS